VNCDDWQEYSQHVADIPDLSQSPVSTSADATLLSKHSRLALTQDDADEPACSMEDVIQLLQLLSAIASDTQSTGAQTFDYYFIKVKGKPEHLYSTLHGTNHSKALRHGSHSFNLQRTPCLPLPRNRSPDGTSTECLGEHLIAAHHSFIYPERMKGWVGLAGWPIADGLPT